MIECKLFDVGPVTFPASEKTEVKLRNAFTELGLNYNKLNLITLKVKRNIELTESDIEYLKNTIKTFNAFIPIIEPCETHSNEIEPVNTTLESLMLDKKIEVNKILRGI